MNNAINIRRATIEDIDVLVQVARKSFYSAFAHFPENSPEDLKSYMDRAYTVEALAAELAERDVTYFVAEIEGMLIGYAKLKQNSREEGVMGDNPIELCRLYNLQEFIGKGVGKALMLKCLEFAEANRHDTIWLGVWEDNTSAINFYRRFGFEKCGEHVFQLGEDPQTDWLMQLMLRSVGNPNEDIIVSSKQGVANPLK
jgi:ribosomal protein S18 acetylase RimI-like enzyme